MIRRLLFLAFANFLILQPPLLAQSRDSSRGNGHDRGAENGQRGNAGAGSHAVPVFRGGSRGPVGWGAFHHDTASARAVPHRFGVTNLPRPNAWRGNGRDFDLGNWQGGRWLHADHNGRFGWWWTVGPSWYFFNAPVYPYPDLYTPVGMSLGWWYWCDPYQEYYPYVTYCPAPWESVMPRE